MNALFARHNAGAENSAVIASLTETEYSAAYAMTEFTSLFLATLSGY
ncbi:hypothetical protein ACW9UR_14965 [Halovulum sp. GXIMD14794]